MSKEQREAWIEGADWANLTGAFTDEQIEAEALRRYLDAPAVFEDDKLYGPPAPKRIEVPREVFYPKKAPKRWRCPSCGIVPDDLVVKRNGRWRHYRQPVVSDGELCGPVEEESLKVVDAEKLEELRDAIHGLGASSYTNSNEVYRDEVIDEIDEVLETAREDYTEGYKNAYEIQKDHNLRAREEGGALREALEKWQAYRKLRKLGDGPGTALAYEQACEDTDAALYVDKGSGVPSQEELDDIVKELKAAAHPPKQGETASEKGGEG